MRGRCQSVSLADAVAMHGQVHSMTKAGEGVTIDRLPCAFKHSQWKGCICVSRALQGDGGLSLAASHPHCTSVGPLVTCTQRRSKSSRRLTRACAAHACCPLIHTMHHAGSAPFPSPRPHLETRGQPG